MVAAVGGNAGAGGVMLALGADRVLLRDGVVLNPHYRSMGLHGSEYWTYVLPRRVGRPTAAALTERCQPVGAREAVRIGLVDAVLPGPPDRFDAAVRDEARRLAADHEPLLDRKRVVRAADEERKPLAAYRVEELAEMSRDIFDDRNGFARKRRAFLSRRPAPSRVGAAETAA